MKPGYIYPLAQVDPGDEFPLTHPICGFTGVIWPRQTSYRQSYQDPQAVRDELKRAMQADDLDQYILEAIDQVYQEVRELNNETTETETFELDES